MTLFHFGNCFALAYVPYFLTYKYSGLSEYGAFRKCIQAGAMYIATQLCKMLFLATFFPMSDTVHPGGLDILGEFFKCTVDFADIFGIHLVMSWVAGKGEMKFLIAGIGWATAELIMTRFLPLWVGARGVEFSWKYVQMSLDSNIRLVHHITMATLIWLWGRNDLKKGLLPFVSIMLIMNCYKPLILGFMTQSLSINAWSVLGIDALVSLTCGLTSLYLYIGLTSVFASYSS